jgi:hypothetical protein
VRETSLSRWLQANLSLHLQPWRWRRYVPPKRRFTQDPQEATPQKTACFIVTAVKTSNLTYTVFLANHSHRPYIQHAWTQSMQMNLQYKNM